MSTPGTTKKPMKKAQIEATPKVSPAAEDAAADAPASPRKAKPARKNGHAAPKPVTSGPIEVKVKRSKKEKVIRDSFTMPKSDYEKIATLKQKCLDAGVPVKKSELLRAGLTLLESIPVKRLMAAVAALETVKTGRPKESQ